MAEYVENFASKLDWAMPFQRTGKFPLDRTDMFSSYADLIAYAKQDGTDSRKLGGTSYIGQIVTVYGKGPDAATDEIAVYVITQVGTDAAVQKLAQSTATGDIGEAVTELQQQMSAVQGDITEINGKLVLASATKEGFMSSAQFTKLEGIAEGAQVNVVEGVAVKSTADGSFVDLQIVAKKCQLDLSNYATKQDLAAIPKFQIKVVAELPETGEEATIYLVNHSHGEQDVYDEYIWTGSAYEKIGNTDIDLSGYATIEAMNEAIATAVADMATQTWVTGQLAPYAKTADVNALLEDKADKTVVDGLVTDNTTNKADIAQLKTDVASKVNISQVNEAIAGATIQGSQVQGAVAQASNATNADKVGHTLTIFGESFDGSADVNAVLPKATNEAVGGILIGYETSGTNYGVQLDESGKAFVTVPVPEVTPYTAGAGLALNDHEFSVANGGILTAMIGDGQVTDAKIAEVNVNKLTQTEGDELILDGGTSI